MLFYGILCVLVGIIPAWGEVFSSVDRMKQLPGIEQKLIAACDRFLERKHDIRGFAKFKRFLGFARKQNERALTSGKYVENPINAFKVLWRLSQRWMAATSVSDEQIVIADDNKDFLGKIHNSIKNVSLWPTAEDITGAVTGLVRLSRVFNLDINQLIDGNIGPYHTEPLTGDEVFAIVEVIHQTDGNGEVMVWLNKSIVMMTSENMERNVIQAALKLKTELLDNIQTKKQEHYSVREIKKCNKSLCRGDLLSATTTMNPRGLKSIQHNAEFHSKCHAKYEELCRENTQTARDISRLYCQYKRTKFPLIRAKVEYVNNHPPIMLFHDVISNFESDWIINTSRNLLSRSMMGKFNSSDEYYGKKRISQSAWIFDDLALSGRLSRRIALLTGLSTKLLEEDTHAEAFQILNYGLGGMYEPHEDSVRLYRETGEEDNKAVQNSGDRIATWMFYLSDVEVGGSTVFPVLNARVPVTKGAAAFWYNLKQNGDADIRTIHAGCPILIGDKWVANKWIREVGQTFRRPCALDPDL